MNNGSLALMIPIISTIGAFLLIFGIYYLRNRERMAMIERGLEFKEAFPKSKTNNTVALTFGLLLIGAGLGLFVAYMMDHFALGGEGNPAIYFSLIAIFGGLGLLISYLIEQKANKNKEL